MTDGREASLPRRARGTGIKGGLWARQRPEADGCGQDKREREGGREGGLFSERTLAIGIGRRAVVVRKRVLAREGLCDNDTQPRRKLVPN